MNKKHLEILELPKILQLLSSQCSIADAKEQALEICPEESLPLASALLHQTEAAYTLLARFGSPSFGSAKNINSPLSRAAAGGSLNMRELLDVGEVLRVIRSVYEWRFNQPGADSCLDAYFASLVPQKALEDDIFSSILTEEELADTASPALNDIRRKIRNKAASIREKLEQLIRSEYYQKFLQESIITTRNGRYVVPVKAECRGEVKGLVHDTSGSGATVFVEPISVVEANNDIRLLQGQEREEIERILAALSAAVGGFADSIKHNYGALTELNLIFAKASLAYKMKASLPILNDEGITELNRARHPLIDEKKVVATDIALGRDYGTLVVTGPNTGGKTVTLKTLGLLTLMAQCGLFIPAGDESKLAVYRDVFADIGDEQSIEQSLSTFSSHIVNIVDILSKADEKSLVLIDELGAGTDPVEGAALAIAILDELKTKGAHIAATTHYAELKAYALKTQGVENACCEFDVETLRPTYRLLTGVPGRSNAFAISARLGMDENILARAKTLVSSDSLRFEDVVDSLEQTRMKLENEIKKAEEDRRELQKKLDAAENKLSEAERLRDSELEKAKSEAMKISENARREANSLLLEVDKLRREMRDTKDAGELARRAKASMKRGLNDLDAVINPVTSSLFDDDDYTLPRPLVKGDTVIIAGMGTEAAVINTADKRGLIEVQAGAMRMRVTADKLRLVEKKKKKETKTSVSSVRTDGGRLNASAENKVDLRGMTKDEAILTLESFLDGMLMTGLDEFTVIHGNATGALRSAVRSYLKTNRFVKTFRPGVYGEGENGVTIVTLK